MKFSNYEERGVMLFIVIFLFLFEGFFLTFLFRKKEYIYQKMFGIMTGQNYATFFVTKVQRGLFYQNHSFLVHDKEFSYEVFYDHLIEDSDKNYPYYELIIKSQSFDELRTNEMVEISIKEKRATIFQILKQEWEGD